MALRSFFSPTMPLSRVYDLTFLLFWIYSTYLTWTVIGPALLSANRMRFQKDITESTRLVVDIAIMWNVAILYLCIVLSVGCIAGCWPNSRFRARFIGFIHKQIRWVYVCVSYACYATASLMGSRGGEVVAKACQEITLADGMCRYAQTNVTAFGIAFVLGCHFVGLGMAMLTWFWHVCAIREQTRVREMIEEEVREGAGLVQLAEDKTLDVGDKV